MLCRTGANVIKLFFFDNDAPDKQARVFVPNIVSLVFYLRVSPWPTRVEYFSVGRVFILPDTIRLGKG
jgi:hypothetical protein